MKFNNEIALALIFKLNNSDRLKAPKIKLFIFFHHKYKVMVCQSKMSCVYKVELWKWKRHRDIKLVMKVHHSSLYVHNFDTLKKLRHSTNYFIAHLNI